MPSGSHPGPGARRSPVRRSSHFWPTSSKPTRRLPTPSRHARLEKLALIGYGTHYWGREGLGRGGLNALIAGGLLQRLKHLRLELLPLGDEGVSALAPALGEQLQTLELVDVYCKGDGAAALALSPCLPSLRRLDLSGNRIDAQRFAQMAAVPMPHLQSLDLSGPGDGRAAILNGGERRAADFTDCPVEC